MLLLLIIGVLLPDSSQILAMKICNCSIGSNVRMNLSNSENVRYHGQLYLNTDEEAHCNGTITSVDYCYYGPSQYNSNLVWVAGITLYRSQEDGMYRRVFDGLPLIKHTPLHQDSPNPRTDLLLNFNCDTYLLNSILNVQKGDIFGALILADSFQLTKPKVMLGGLDLVGDSSSGYQMLTKSVTIDEIESFDEIQNIIVQLLDTSNGLSRDTESRVLHVYANIIPQCDPRSNITPSRPLDRSPTLGGTTTTSIKDPHSTILITTTSIVENKPTTENEKTDDVIFSTESSTQPMPIVVESSPPQSIIIGGVLGAIVIIGILISIAIALAILHRRVRRQPRQVSTKQAVNLKNASMIESDLNALGNMEAEAYSEPLDQRAVPFTTELNEYAMVGPNTSKAEHGTMEGDHVYFVLDHFYFMLEGPKCPYTELLEKNKTEDIYEHVTRYHEPAKQERDLYSQIKSFGIKHIDRDSIQIQNQLLGSGQFGSVKSGIWTAGKSEVKVAVKSLNPKGISEETRVRFLQEAAIMAQFRHANVAFLYGVVIEGEPIMLVVELAEKGDLKKYLMSIKTNPGEISSNDLPSLLLNFSQHVALGMQYLSGKGFVHRDLAARNILVSNNNVCKVADFGMSRDLADENYYISHGGMIPVKWTAPEAIHYKKYSTTSDVWSYGCLLYEIWSLALKPFEDTSNFEVIQMLDKGERLPPPSGSPRIIYELMIHCWHPTAADRPNFRELVLALTGEKGQVLLIPQPDGDSHPLARVLGAPFEAGKNMYKDLQNKYIV